MKLGWVIFHTTMVFCTGGLWLIPLVIWKLIK